MQLHFKRTRHILINIKVSSDKSHDEVTLKHKIYHVNKINKSAREKKISLNKTKMLQSANLSIILDNYII